MPISFFAISPFLEVTAINSVEHADAAAQGKKSVQGILAREVTRLVHGPEGLAAAERVSRALFSGAFNELTEGDLEQLALDGMPCTEIDVPSKAIVDVLVDSGLAVTPRGEVTLGQARKFVRDGAVSVNSVKVGDDQALVTRADAYYGHFHILCRGKKNFHLLRWV